MEHLVDSLYEHLPKPILVQSRAPFRIYAQCPDLVLTDYIAKDVYPCLLEKANLVLMHAGVGATYDVLRHEVPFIAVSRAHIWHEHVDEHQQQWLAFLESLYDINVVDYALLCNPDYCRTLVREALTRRHDVAALETYFNSDLVGIAVERIISSFLF